jgi:hypothetical protein
MLSHVRQAFVEAKAAILATVREFDARLAPEAAVGDPILGLIATGQSGLADFGSPLGVDQRAATELRRVSHAVGILAPNARVKLEVAVMPVMKLAVKSSWFLPRWLSATIVKVTGGILGTGFVLADGVLLARASVSAGAAAFLKWFYTTKPFTVSHYFGLVVSLGVYYTLFNCVCGIVGFVLGAGFELFLPFAVTVAMAIGTASLLYLIMLVTHWIVIASKSSVRARGPAEVVEPWPA